MVIRMYKDYLNKNVRIISKVIFRNKREINTRYFGIVIKIEKDYIVLKENDGHIVNVQLKHIKRIEEYYE